MAKRSKVEVDQRMEAVMALLRRDQSAVKIAWRVGVSEQTLYRWRDQILDGGQGGTGRRTGQGR